MKFMATFSEVFYCKRQLDNTVAAMLYYLRKDDTMKYNPSQAVKENIPCPEPQRYNMVVKSNSLIQQSRFSLSTQQQKIVLFIISQIEPSDEELKLYSFKITDFCNVCGIEPQGNMYNLLKRQIKSISDKSLWIETEQGQETLVRWIEKPYIDKKSGTIQIKLDEDMKPYLLQLKEKFTEYELIYTLNFKSKYSIRLYEFLKSIHYNKMQAYTQTLPIDKFQKVMDSTYANFKDFHTRALKPAQKEINEYSDILFNYELVSDGRRTTAIKITVSPKSAGTKYETSITNELLLEERRGNGNGE